MAVTGSPLLAVPAIGNHSVMRAPGQLLQADFERIVRALLAEGRGSYVIQMDIPQPRRRRSPANKQEDEHRWLRHIASLYWGVFFKRNAHLEPCKPFDPDAVNWPTKRDIDRQASYSRGWVERRLRRLGYGWPPPTHAQLDADEIQRDTET